MSKDTLKCFEIAAKIALFIFGLSLGMVLLVAGTKAALAASLRSDTVITDEYIRLGDIFDGVKNADYVLGPAPQPGKDMILNASTLYRVASALDVDWKPSSNTDQVILRREATVIPQSEITAALEENIKKAGVTDKFSIQYINTISDIVLPADAETTLAVTAFNYNAQNDTFNAVVVAPSAENPLKRVNISARINRMVAVPVLKNSLRNGDVIGALDIDYIDMAESNLPHGTIVDEKHLVNMTPRRTINAGKIVSQNDLESPKMVDRGDSVTLIFETGAMTLTAKGKSLQAGAMGDTVRVANTDSDKSLQGVVTGSREVTIR